MKTILIVLGVLLISGILFFLIGVVSPGLTNETVVKINSPLKYTWDLYHDDEVLKEWVPGLQEIKLISGQTAEVGSKYILTMKDEKGKITTMDETITAFDQNEKYAMDYSNDMLDGHVDVLFEGKGDSTIIKSINSYKGKTTLLRSMLHFFNGKILSETDKQYENFKLIAEERYLKIKDNQARIIDAKVATPNDTLSIDTLSKKKLVEYESEN